MAPRFNVDPEQLKAVAQRTDTVADGVSHVEATVTSCAPRGPDIFGLFGVVEAYQRFHERWSADLHITAGAARQLADGLHRAAGDYSSADNSAARRFR